MAGGRIRRRPRRSSHRHDKSPLDLAKILPLPTHNEHDGGPYIAAGIMIVRNPKTGKQNVSIHRCQLTGPNRLGVLVLPRHTFTFQRMAEDAGQPLDAALVVGVDPLTLLASQAIVPLDHDELEIAGALQGRPLPVVKCVASDIRVPAEAEIVIEGRFLPHVREPEGPFGEFPQYYGERAPREVMEIVAVTHRKDAIFHTIVGGGLEHRFLGAIPKEATLLTHLRRNFLERRSMCICRPAASCASTSTSRSRRPRRAQGKNVILGAFAGYFDLKHVIVVDEDVDIHNPTEVEWAVATRFQADRDLVIVPESQGSKLDPSNRDGRRRQDGARCHQALQGPGDGVQAHPRAGRGGHQRGRRARGRTATPTGDKALKS